jgi:hypothetical protein
MTKTRSLGPLIWVLHLPRPLPAVTWCSELVSAANSNAFRKSIHAWCAMEFRFPVRAPQCNCSSLLSVRYSMLLLAGHPRQLAAVVGPAQGAASEGPCIPAVRCAASSGDQQHSQSSCWYAGVHAGSLQQVSSGGMGVALDQAGGKQPTSCQLTGPPHQGQGCRLSAPNLQLKASRWSPGTSCPSIAP